jgi:hypothetical protein
MKYEPMNERMSHGFSFSNKFVHQMCFQYTILMRETYELWLNEFCTISITKSWNVKFTMTFHFQKTCKENQTNLEDIKP